jgi:hypothetical protein
MLAARKANCSFVTLDSDFALLGLSDLDLRAQETFYCRRY